MAERAVLGVDVGGTDIKAVLVQGGRIVRALPAVPTPRDDPSGRQVADAVARLVRACGPEGSVGAVGVAVPGVVDEQEGVCLLSVNLGWRDLPVQRLAAAATGLPTVLVHDVRAGARAEHASGAGAGRQGGLLFAALGTGLAVATLDAAGTPIGGPWAGEAGQVRWTSGPHAGLRVEQVVSAGGLAARFGAPDALAVVAALRAGDPRAATLWQQTAEALAELLAWSAALTAPATIVVGGGLARSGELLLAPVRASLAERLPGFPPPEVLPAVHGVLAAAIGAAVPAAGLLDPA